MSIESKFTPMAYAQTERIRTAAILPLEMEEQVGLNLHKLYTLMQIGGIRHLRIENDKVNNNTSRLNVMITGFNSQGGGYGGSASSEMVPPSLEEVETTSGKTPKQARWIDLTVKLNVAEMTQRILHSDDSVKDPGKWAEQIHELLKGTIIKVGSKHLLSVGKWESLYMAFLYSQSLARSGGVGLFEGYNPHSIEPSVALLNLLTTGLIQNFTWSLIYGRERVGRGRRLSLFYGVEADRALVLILAANTGKLAQKANLDA
jgi:hypothetical protein